MNKLVEVDIDALNETLLDYLVTRHSVGSTYDELMNIEPVSECGEIVILIKSDVLDHALVFGKVTLAEKVCLGKKLNQALGLESEDITYSNKLYDESTLTGLIFKRRINISFNGDLTTATLGQFSNTHLNAHIAVLSTVLKSALTSNTVNIDPALIEICDTSLRKKAEIREQRRLSRAEQKRIE